MKEISLCVVVVFLPLSSALTTRRKDGEVLEEVVTVVVGDYRNESSLMRRNGSCGRKLGGDE